MFTLKVQSPSTSESSQVLERVDKISHDVGLMKTRQDEMSQDVGLMKTRQKEMSQDVGHMKTRQDHMEYKQEQVNEEVSLQFNFSLVPL